MVEKYYNPFCCIILNAPMGIYVGFGVYGVSKQLVIVCIFYLVVVYKVEDQVYISMYGLVLSQLRFHSVKPVNQGLESICKLA